MAKINISFPEDKKEPVTGNTGGTGNTGNKPATGGNSGTGTGGEIVARPDNGTFQPGGSIAPLYNYIQKNPEFPQGVYYPTAGTASGTNKVNKNQAAAETSISKLKSDYANQLRDNYNYSAEKLRDERDAALRESWVAQQRDEAALPERMAAAGINGGAAETSLAALKAKYQGNRNDIRSGYLDNLGELGVNHQNLSADAQRQYDQQWLEYLLSLARMEEQAKYD